MSYVPSTSIAAAYRWLPNAEQVTVTPAGPSSNNAPITGVMGIRRALSLDKLQALGGLSVQPGDLVFNLWADMFQGRAISEGDKITDAAGQNYVVISADLMTFGTRWRAVARKAVG